ncbi:protein sidekick-2 [Sinocyclocheilus grahami]|uniref:protein sidekick-2 n=1 Tax=Sinocyclocheilus grahami TaxID=75366 RepID=UPI0007ACE74B|nr:PREDICTED: protein sidekick-2-like [Sinocyclocheilus grahami]
MCRTKAFSISPSASLAMFGNSGKARKRPCWIVILLSVLLHLASAQDDVPPYFKTEPVPSQLHLERNRLVLTCMAEGSWPLEFKWIHNDTEITRFSLEYRYLIPSLDRSHAGFYRCIVRNRVGALLQRRTEVQVAYMGSFEEGERAQAVSQGEGAVIPAPRIRCFPQPQVTWFRDGRKIPPSSRIAITLDNTLVILSTVAPDAGRYYVQAVNDKNGENKTGQPITLSVENVGGPADPIAPTIVIPPRNTSVISGTSEVTMECVANARPLIKLSISWKKDGVPVRSGLSDFNRKLTVLSPVVSDSGFYECEAVLRSSSVPSVSAGAYLHVLEPPQFVKEPEKHITAEMEKVVDIPCQARGVPQPDIVWYKDAVPISPVKTPRYRVLAGGSLQVNGLLPDDTGMFQCFARNQAGEVQTNTYLAVTSIAPNITAGPSDSTVIDGMSVILHCETSGAPRPAITWQKGERVLASGSVQLPRFTLLESGSLLISPSHISDAGTYTCMASNSRGIDEASADLVVWARTRITNPPQDQSVIKGTKATMTCGVTHDPSVSVRFVWEKEGQVVIPQSLPRLRLDVNGTLHISQTWSGDIGTYTCRVTSVGGNDSRSAHLRVRQLPHAPENPSAVLSTTEKRAINLTWAKPFDGNSPLIRYILEVSENNAPWTVLLANIEPESTAVTVNGLIPARSYQFRLCAVNDVGKGQFSKETERYRLTGLPVDIQYKNISNPDVTNLLLEDLIIWTNYEIEVAAYNGAGLGVYSHKVTEWTLQGVPTIAPGNVKAEPVNSTTIRFTWTAPNPQFINGINQGYKLLAWEPGKEDEMTIVTVRPNFQDSVHVGHITGLKKFSEYFTSVLCFTTPGDGPRSPPRRLRTHEDSPGAVGHLSFTEILDTSLKVSWREPNEKNGILTGYRISWEEYNRTNTRVTHYLPNVTLEYRVTGLTALTTYTIEVAGMTSKGQGQLSSSTISSGVPPEHPGPPTNLAISNIGPRSVTLQFKPGYDGKTSISRWQVEAQVGVIGENEDWVMVHQLANEPDARSLEVSGLNPYTFYRFRMRQVNIVGTSPPSQPSRKIQTLQAPPDMAPANVTLRTASETSLWLRWVPLPEWEYNGNPDSVGYRVQYSRTRAQSKYLLHVIADRLEREFTIEDLEEWTEYEVRVQAINGIGAGPWSQPVRGRTRESVPSCGPTNVSAFATTSSSILVRWFEVPEPDRNGLILGYKVVYKEKDSDSPLKFWMVEGNASHSVQLTGLGKYVLYEIQVLAFTRIGDGRPSTPSILERTLDDVPGPPVVILFPEVRTTSVRLIWQPPSQPNGIILAYQITYRLNSTNSNTATFDVLNSSARQYTVTGLRPESVYVFRIRAQTRKGWGEAAEALVVTTEKRGNAYIQSATATQFDVTWDPPPLETQNGDIQGYKIFFWEYKRKNETEKLRTLFLPEGGVKLKNLTGYTTYMISVAAFNAAGDGPRSPPTRGRTQQAAPSAPSFIHFSELTTTSVNVSWGEPVFPNGIIEGYRLIYEPCMPVDGVSKIVTVDVKGNAPLWLKIKDLADGVTYNFRIRAKTFTYGPEVEANITTGPGEGAPGPPGEPFISRYGSALTIHWTNGDPGRAPITRYVIEARPSDEGLWDILIKDIPKEVTSYTFNMDILKQGVSYDFRVIGVNDYGYGSPSQPSPSISAQKVAPFYEEWWFLVVVALVGLIFILLLVFILIIRGQSKKYAKKSDSSNNSNCNALTHGEMVSLDESRFPALELNNRRLSVKNSFCRKNGVYTRSPPRPSPGSLHYSDEDVSTKYNDLIPAESSSLTEKPSEISDSQDKTRCDETFSKVGYSPAGKEALVFSFKTGGLHTLPTQRGSDSEYEVDPNRQKTHSFVNHYISDPTYFNSWRRQQKGISRAQAYNYTESESGEPEPCAPPPPLPPLPPLPPFPPQLSSPTPQSQSQTGSLFRPKGSRTPTPSQQSSNPPSQHSTLYRPPSSLAPGSRAPIAGFSSFV